MRRWNVRPMETKRGVRHPPDAPQPQELQPFQEPQVHGQRPQTLQVTLPDTVPQEPQPQLPQVFQLLQRLQPQEKSPATRPQGAQGLQAGVPSLATQPQVLLLQLLHPQELQPVPQLLAWQPFWQPHQEPRREQERELQLLISSASVTWSVGVVSTVSLCEGRAEVRI